MRITELDISELSAWFRSLHRDKRLAPTTVRQIRLAGGKLGADALVCSTPARSSCAARP